MQEQPTAEAGWYAHGNGQRYWDGTTWTDHAAPGMPGAPVPYGPQNGAVAARPSTGTAPATPMMIAPKNPAIALLASFFVPGLGSMMNGDVGKGIVILIGDLVAFALSFFLIGIPFAIGFWIWGMADAYQGAQRWNAAHGIVS